MRRPRAGTLAALLCAAAGAAAAQEPAAFDARCAEMRSAPTDEARRRAAAAASDAFLALPAGEARRARLAAGAEATLLAGRVAIAADLAREARAAAPTGPVVTLHLCALAQAARLGDFVQAAREDRSANPAAVEAALLAEHARLLPLADAAARRGEVDLARFVFGSLAAIEPPDAVRIADFALLLRHVGDVGAAREAYERARTLAPHDATIENDFGLFLRATGDRARALVAFRRSFELDAVAAGGRRGGGPAVTNILFEEAVRPGTVTPDPLPDASAALAVRPDAALLRRLVLDVSLDRASGRRLFEAMVDRPPVR